MIHDHDMGIVCDENGCTRQAYYTCTVTPPKGGVKDINDLCATGIYCPTHTAELLQRAAELLEDPKYDGIKLHDVIQVDHLIAGAEL